MAGQTMDPGWGVLEKAWEDPFMTFWGFPGDWSVGGTAAWQPRWKPWSFQLWLMSCLQGAGPSRCYSSFSSNTFYLLLFMILCFCLSLIDVYIPIFQINYEHPGSVSVVGWLSLDVSGGHFCWFRLPLIYSYLDSGTWGVEETAWPLHVSFSCGWNKKVTSTKFSSMG